MRTRLIGLTAAAVLGAGSAFGVAACGGKDKTTTETVNAPANVPVAPTTPPTTVKPQTLTTQTHTTTTPPTTATNSGGGSSY